MKIRRGKKEDLKDYIKLQLSEWPNESKERHKRYFLQKLERDEIWVLEINKKYAGHLTFSKLISAPFPDSVYAEELLIAKEHRGNGIGTELMDRLVKKTKSLGFDRILLDTHDSRYNKAIRFYKKHGFRRVGFLKTEFGDEAFFESKVKDWK